MTSSKSIQLEKKLLLIASAAALLTWFHPLFRVISLPLIYLNTHIHEFCHALAAIITGGRAEYINVFSTGGGVTPVVGGNILLTASAGYVGSSIIGALMIYFGHSEKVAKQTLLVLGFTLIVSCLLWVRGDAVGLSWGIFWIVLCFTLAKGLRGAPIMFAAQFIGLLQCLNSAQALLTLLKINVGSDIQNDASLMESVTHVPGIIWAIAWSILSLGLILVALKSSWQRQEKSSELKK